MIDKEIIRMAEESGLLNPPQDGLDWSAPLPNSDYLQRIERFAARVAEAEREASAKVCDDRYTGDNNREDMEARRCAAAIRARGTP